MVSTAAQCYDSPGESYNTAEYYKAPGEKCNIQLADCHVHVGFMSNAEQVARDALREGLLLFVNTVTPQEYLTLHEQEWARLPNVRLGLGLHPWWVARGMGMPSRLQSTLREPPQPQYVTREDIALAATLARKATWIGEVGLDFSPKHTDPSSHEAQVSALRTMLEACVSPLALDSSTCSANVTRSPEGCIALEPPPNRVISLHSVASADIVLDLLEQTGVTDTCTCVFHWFSGSTPALWRAIRMGCWFSVNEMQARTRRAKEQLKLVPDDRLLLETDLPSKQFEMSSTEMIGGSLLTTCRLLSDIRRTEPEHIQKLTSHNAALLLGPMA